MTIVYVSNTGFTQHYAKLLAENLSIPYMTLKDAKDKLNGNDEIIFMSWLFANKIREYEKANKLFKIKAVAAVGMAKSTDEYLKIIVDGNKLGELPAFYLRGGMRKEKLKGINKFVINMIIRMLKKNKPNDEMLNIMTNGGDFVSMENLDGVIKWYKNL